MMQPIDLSAPMTSQEKELLELALGVLRSDQEHADFLNFWLTEYGRPLLSGQPLEPLLPAPETEEELDELEAEFNSRFGLLIQ